MDNEGAIVTVEHPTATDVVIAEQRGGYQVAMLQMLERLARDPSVNVASLVALNEIRKEEVADARRLEFEDAMALAMNEMEPIRKDMENKETHSKYPSPAAIDNAIRPIYTKHGFSQSFNSIEPPEGKELCLECILSHRGGHTRLYSLATAIDDVGIRGTKNKTPIHALASAVTLVRRYLTGMVWSLSYFGDDDDGNRAGRSSSYKPTLMQDSAPNDDRRPTDRPPSRVEAWVAALKAEKDGDKWLLLLNKLADGCESVTHMRELQTLDAVVRVYDSAPPDIRMKFNNLWGRTVARLSPKADDPPAETEKQEPAQQTEMDKVAAEAKFDPVNIYPVDQHGEVLAALMSPIQFCNWMCTQLTTPGMDIPAVVNANRENVIAASEASEAAHKILDEAIRAAVATKETKETKEDPDTGSGAAALAETLNKPADPAATALKDKAYAWTIKDQIDALTRESDYHKLWKDVELLDWAKRMKATNPEVAKLVGNANDKARKRLGITRKAA
jgi:hypothetical protein